MSSWEPYSLGRLDVNGVEWFACDPYPTWFRWEGKTLRTNPARFADLPHVEEDEYDGPIYGTGPHDRSCDGKVRPKWSGVGCSCGARWFCY
jgi:hypothetical protein